MGRIGQSPPYGVPQSSQAVIQPLPLCRMPADTTSATLPEAGHHAPDDAVSFVSVRVHVTGASLCRVWSAGWPTTADENPPDARGRELLIVVDLPQRTA